MLRACRAQQPLKPLLNLNKACSPPNRCLLRSASLEAHIFPALFSALDRLTGAEKKTTVHLAPSLPRTEAPPSLIRLDWQLEREAQNPAANGNPRYSPPLPHRSPPQKQPAPSIRPIDPVSHRGVGTCLSLCVREKNDSAAMICSGSPLTFWSPGDISR